MYYNVELKKTIDQVKNPDKVEIRWINTLNLNKRLNPQQKGFLKNLLISYGLWEELTPSLKKNILNNSSYGFDLELIYLDVFLNSPCLDFLLKQILPKQLSVKKITDMSNVNVDPFGFGNISINFIVNENVNTFKNLIFTIHENGSLELLDKDVLERIMIENPLNVYKYLENYIIN